MRHRKISITLAAAILCGMATIAVPPAFAAQTIRPDNTVVEPDNTRAIVEPDNTRVNQNDRNTGGLTAEQQGSGKPDRELTRQIRQAIIADKGLSTYAHNVKIITQDGTVTLKGPVRSDQDRQGVLNAAMRVTNNRNVRDEMSIKLSK